MDLHRLRFLHFRRDDYLGLFTAGRYLAVAGWQVYVRRVDLSSWLETPAMDSVAPACVAPADFPGRAAQYVDIASRHPFRWARCLQRSLALCLWLEARGFHPALNIGVRKEGAKLKAHAWVKVNGAIINDNADIEEKFVTLPALGSPAGPLPGQAGRDTP
jgi:hypothetical protein